VNPEPTPKPRPDFFHIDKDRHSPSFELWTFQTAFRQLEPTCRPTGSWSDTFETLLVDYKKGHGLGALPRIDAPTWEKALTDAQVYAQPWAGAVPTEADIVQLVMDEHHKVQPSTLPAKYTSRRLKVDVLVHQRGLAPVKAANVSVLLLMRKLPEAEHDWPSLAIDADWKQSTVLAVASGGLPAAGWTDGWEPADPTLVRHPPNRADLCAATPQAVTFDLALPAPSPMDIRTAFYPVMLLAVCSSPTATLVEERLPGDNLRDLLAQSKHVAAHVLTPT
jgi:hypothetical protein